MQASRRNQSALGGRRLVFFGLAAIPLVCVVLLVIRYGVDLPYRDQWVFVSLIREARQGTLSLHDLWLAQNEHRILFPRIVLLSLAGITGWNIYYELAVNIVLATGILALIVHQTQRTRLSLGANGPDFLIPALSLMVYSLKQSENWLFGIQLAFWMNVLAVVCGIIVLAMPVFKWWRFVVALLLGVVASYSAANGMLYWLIALPGLFTLPLRDRRAKWICRVTWLLVAVATIGSYLHHYDTPPSDRTIDFFVRQPLGYITYILCYLGNPVGPNHILATCLAGLFGVLILPVTGFLLIRSRRLTMQALLPYFSLALYSLGSALITGAGRAQLGPLQAKVSRYVTTANPLWIAILVLLYLLFRVSLLEGGEHGAGGRGRRALAGASLAVFVMILLAVGRGSVKEIPVFQDWHARLAPARAELVSGRTPDLLKEAWPGVDMTTEISFLREHNLSVFRES